MLFAPVLRQATYAPSLRSVDRGVERFFNELAFARPTGQRFTQDERSWTLSLDLPGIAKDQLSIQIEGPVVRIASTEGAARKVKAAYELPLDIDAAASTAALENGVLTLTLVKKLPESKATALAIQ